MLGRRRHLQLHAQVLRRLGQPRYQCHAVDQVHGPAMARQVVQVPAEALAHVQQGLGRTGHVEERGKVGAGHDRHAHERGFAQGLAQAWQQCTHLAGIVRCGNHLMPTFGGARGVAVHVRYRIAVGKLQRRMLLEKRHHVRAGFKESVHPFGIVMGTQLIAQVGPWLLDVFIDAGAARQRVARDPGPATGPGRGAAQHWLLFYQNHLLPMPGSCYSGGQPGGA